MIITLSKLLTPKSPFLLRVLHILQINTVYYMQLLVLMTVIIKLQWNNKIT